MATSSEIKQRANALAEKTDVNSITPREVGGIMYDLASHGENVLRNGGTLGIRKVYESVAAMEADSTNPKDFWGDPIKKGNLVVIYDGTTTGVDNNKIYAFMKPGWQIATHLDAGYATKASLDAAIENVLLQFRNSDKALNESIGNLEKTVTGNKQEVDAKLSELGQEVNGLDLRLTSSFGFTKDQYVWGYPTNAKSLKGFYRPNGEFVESQAHLTGVIDVVYGQLIEVSYNIVNYSKNISLLSYWKDEELLETPFSTDTYQDYKGSFIISIPQGVNKISVFGDIKVITSDKKDININKLNLYNNFASLTGSNIALEKDYKWTSPNTNTTEILEGFYRPNGEFVSSAHTTRLIEVTPLQLVKLDIDYSNYSNAALITLWNNDNLIGTPLTSDLYSEYKGTVIVTIPKNVNKIGVMGVINATIVPQVRKEEANNADLLVNALQIESGNLVLSSNVYEELGIDNLGKIQYPSQGGWNLCVVKVKPNTTYYIRANSYKENSVGALGYSDTENVTAGKTVSEVDMDSLPSYNEYKVFTTDDTTEYLYINLTPLLKDNNVVIKENIDDLEIPTTIGEREILKQLESIDSGVSSFVDKKIALFGDSITHQAIGSYPNRGWATYFNQILQFGELVNYARSGATWSNTENTIYNITENTGSLSNDNVIYNQFNRLLNDISNGEKVPDYIIIAAGTNDAWYPSYRPNALSKTAKEVFEDEATNYLDSVNINQCTSIAQAFRYVAEMIIKNLPNVKVLICTPLQSTAFTAERNNSVTEVISSCANYMSWNVIVQSEECGVSRLQEKRGYINTYDGTHTSEMGAKMIGTYLANKFKSLFGIDFPYK